MRWALGFEYGHLFVFLRFHLRVRPCVLCLKSVNQDYGFWAQEVIAWHVFADASQCRSFLGIVAWRGT